MFLCLTTPWYVWSVTYFLFLTTTPDGSGRFVIGYEVVCGTEAARMSWPTIIPCLLMESKPFFSPLVPKLWFANPLGFRKIFGGIRQKIPVTVFCLNNLHDKTTGNLVSFATAFVSEQSTLVRWLLKLQCLILYRFLVLFLLGVHEVMYYNQRGSQEGKV
jgi:hypothetical protein